MSNRTVQAAAAGLPKITRSEVEKRIADAREYARLADFVAEAVAGDVRTGDRVSMPIEAADALLFATLQARDATAKALEGIVELFKAGRDAPHPDAGLLALGDRLKEAWANENRIAKVLEGDASEAADTAWTEANAATCRVVAKIEKCRATTMEGACVKALAVSWCRSGDPLADKSQDCTDMRIASDLVQDLLAVAEASR